MVSLQTLMADVDDTNEKKEAKAEPHSISQQFVL